MKNRLAVISTKNPKKELLIETINNIKKYYHDFDIVIIDSDSIDKSVFEFVPTDCIIEYCKNKNWELGAWYYAFNKYNNYNIYMFLQDSLIPNSRIPQLDEIIYNEGTIYTFNYNATVSQGGYFEDLKNVYKNSDLHFISELNENEWITGGAHSFFIADNPTVKTVLQLENAYISKNITKTKIDSWLSERTIGIMADKFPTRINVSQFFTKINGMRDYI